jgi:PAS domain S-box-containing protein
MVISKVHHNNDYFRQILENTGDVIWVLNIEKFKLTYISSSIFNLNGYTPEEIMSMDLNELVSPDSYQYILRETPEKIDEILSGKVSTSYYVSEIEMIKKDGSIVSTEVVTTVIAREGRETAEILGISRDISKRKHIEKLVSILNNATTAMQLALSVEEIYQALAVELKKKNIHTTVLLLEQDDQILRPFSYSYDENLINSLELMLGMKIRDFTIIVRDHQEFIQAVKTRQPVLVGEPALFIERILPDPCRNFTAQMVRLLQIPITIIAPLVIEDKVKGILTLQSSLLNDLDIQTVSMFANHLAATWHRGELFEQFKKESEARKIAEVQLSDKDEKYHNILNYSPIGIYQSSKQGKILAANDSLARMLGYLDDREMMETMDWEGLFYSPAERDQFSETYKKASHEVLRNQEILWKKKDGSPIWILLTIHRVFDEYGHYLYDEGFVQDIEVQKRANLALEQSLSQIRATLESTNDGILVVNPESRVTNYNMRFLELWKIPYDLIQTGNDNKVLDFVCAFFDDPGPFVSRINEIYSSPYQDSFDILELNDGRIIERFSHPQILDNVPEGRVWSFRDVTEKVKATEMLRKSENQYRILFEFANDSIFIMSKDKFIACNEMAVKMFECDTEQELLGKNPWDFSPEYQPDGIRSVEKASEYILSAFKGKPQRFSWNHLTQKGQIIQCEISLNRIIYNDSIILQAIVRDVSDRIKTETAIRESEERFRKIFESSPIGIVLVGPDYKFITVNQSFATMLGYSREELVKMTLREITHPDYIGNDVLHLNKLYKGEIPIYKTEKLYIKKSSGEAWGSIIVSAVYNIQGQFLYFLGMIEDITARKQTEKALMESQMQYTSIVDNSNDAIIVYQDDKIRFVNAAIEKLTGFTTEDYIDVNMLDFVAPESRKAVMNYHTNRRKGKPSPSIYEVSMLKKGGGKVPIEMNVNEIQYMGRQAGLIFIRDLTERKKAEFEIRDREFWLSQSQKFARIGSYYLDIYSSDWKCTETLDEIFGIPADYPKNVNTWAGLIYEPDREMMVEYFSNYVVSQKHPFNKEYRIVRVNDGQIRWLHGRGDLTFDETGSPLAMLGTISDITERKLMEEELRVARDKAEESSRLKTSLLLNISHELRTPMNGILGFAEILTHKLLLPDERKMAENILFSGNRLKATLDSIMDLSQVQADHKLVKSECVDLVKVIDGALVNYKDLARSKGILINMSLAQGLCALADENLLSDIFHHLLDNAFKFTDLGSVTIYTYSDASTNRAVIEVQDTGIGIAENNLDFIFDEFRQVSEGMGRSYEGTGVGLTLCKKFAALMNGEIKVKSELGSGSVFTVSLPICSAQEIQAPAKNATEELPSTANRTQSIHNVELPLILVVEDHEFNLELIQIYLRGICRTESTMDGLSAIKLAAEKRYDAIVMDVNLGPGMDGLEASKEIKKLKGYEKVPIIAVTGYTTSEERIHILAQGCSYYLSKPYNKNSLISIVQRALEEATA